MVGSFLAVDTICNLGKEVGMHRIFIPIALRAGADTSRREVGMHKIVIPTVLCTGVGTGGREARMHRIFIPSGL
ncbi:hypothetical protein AMTR_s00006p00225000 [Amborella trichopoda]|uniref:Uncharacterized protein n=1 Tax=Amborella trichopoda TaxID=13333 RepID=W1PDL8_AMBTC|nr:hypothetical protein AMTR_s00006p00225000 [Amborella trichopoda]